MGEGQSWLWETDFSGLKLRHLILSVSCGADPISNWLLRCQSERLDWYGGQSVPTPCFRFSFSKCISRLCHSTKSFWSGSIIGNLFVPTNAMCRGWMVVSSLVRVCAHYNSPVLRSQCVWACGLYYVMSGAEASYVFVADILVDMRWEMAFKVFYAKGI